MSRPKRTAFDQESAIDIAFRAAQTLGRFTYKELAQESGFLEVTVQDYIRRWTNVGKVRLWNTVGHTKTYVTSEHYQELAEKVDAPRGPSTPEDNMWRTMRHLPVFDKTDIAAHSTTADVIVTEQMAQQYCTQLMKVAYLKIAVKAQTGMRPAKYRLVENTGPIAPKIKRMRVVVDENQNAHKILKDGRS